MEQPDSQLQQRDAYGQWLPPDAATVVRQKTALLAALAGRKPLQEAVEAAGISWSTLWNRAQQDDEIAQALESWRKGLGVKSLAAMESDMDAPETSAGLKSPTYGNFRMITAKTAFPDMRDSQKIEVNVGMAVGDWQEAVKAINQESDHA